MPIGIHREAKGKIWRALFVSPDIVERVLNGMALLEDN
jgi:hypothetical protein